MITEWLAATLGLNTTEIDIVAGYATLVALPLIVGGIGRLIGWLED